MRWITVFFAIIILVVPAFGEESSKALRRLQEFYQKTTDYKAQFKQDVKTKTPKRQFHRTGVVFFKKPGMMRWDYQTPNQVYYVSDGEILWCYDVEEQLVYKMKIKGSELFWAMRFLIGASIPNEFDVTEERQTSGGLIPLVMKPRETQTVVSSVTLFVDPNTGEVKESEVIDPLGNISHIKFENPSYLPLPEEGFRFKVPDGVRVQEIGER